jgi:hypothetical protein
MKALKAFSLDSLKFNVAIIKILGTSSPIMLNIVNEEDNVARGATAEKALVESSKLASNSRA